MSKGFNPLMYDIFNVGRHFKGSKKKHVWRFKLDEQQHTIQFYASKLSRKRKVFLNGDLKLESKKSGSGPGTSFPLRIGKHNILIYEQIDGQYDLRCDSLSFHALKLRNKNFQNMNSDSDEQPTYNKKRRYSDEMETPFGRRSQERTQNIQSKISRPIGRARNMTPGPVIKKSEQHIVVQVAKPSIKKEPAKIDLFEVQPSAPIKLENILMQPLNTAVGYNQFQNPFEDQSQSNTGLIFAQSSKQSQSNAANFQPVQEQPRGRKSDLFDLDNLHLGDNYSPAIAKKMDAAHKPMATSTSPNMPMYQLKTEMQSPQMNIPQMVNTNMMNQQMMNQQMMNQQIMNQQMMNQMVMNGMMMQPWMNQRNNRQ